MVYEDDTLEIPEKYKKMSLAELKAEEERIEKTLNFKKTGAVRKKNRRMPN